MKYCFLGVQLRPSLCPLFGPVRSPGRFETTAGVVFEPFQVVPERPGSLQILVFSVQRFLEASKPLFLPIQRLLATSTLVLLSIQSLLEA